MPLPAGCLHRLITRATGGGGAARRGDQLVATVPAGRRARGSRRGEGEGTIHAIPQRLLPSPLFSEFQIGSSSLGNETDVFSFLVALVIRLSSNHGYICVEENRENHVYAGIDCCA